jgi:hypothetical protein
MESTFVSVGVPRDTIPVTYRETDLVGFFELCRSEKLDPRSCQRLLGYIKEYRDRDKELKQSHLYAAWLDGLDEVCSKAGYQNTGYGSGGPISAVLKHVTSFLRSPEVLAEAMARFKAQPVQASQWLGLFSTLEVTKDASVPCLPVALKFPPSAPAAVAQQATSTFEQELASYTGPRNTTIRLRYVHEVFTREGGDLTHEQWFTAFELARTISDPQALLDATRDVTSRS